MVKWEKMVGGREGDEQECRQGAVLLYSIAFPCRRTQRRVTGGFTPLRRQVVAVNARRFALPFFALRRSEAGEDGWIEESVSVR